MLYVGTSTSTNTGTSPFWMIGLTVVGKPAADGDHLVARLAAADRPVSATSGRERHQVRRRAGVDEHAMRSAQNLREVALELRRRSGPWSARSRARNRPGAAISLGVEDAAGAPVRGVSPGTNSRSRERRLRDTRATRSSDLAARAPRPELAHRARNSRYQSMVRRRPSSSVNSGGQPSTRARLGGAEVLVRGSRCCASLRTRARGPSVHQRRIALRPGPARSPGSRWRS